MARVLVLLDQPANRRVLGHWLMSTHEVVTPSEEPGLELEGLSPVDLVLADPSSYDRHAAALAAMRGEARPVFLPVVLMLSRAEAEQAPRELWDEIDEVLTVPVLKQELRGRVEMLLRTRRLSLLAHAELSQIFDSAGNAMCVVGMDRRLDRVNRAFVRLACAEEGQVLLGRELGEILPGAVDVELLNCVFDGGEGCTSEVELGEGDGRRVLLARSTPFHGLDGELFGVIVDLADVTPLKESEAELRASNARLEQALAELQRVQGHLVHKERLHALGQMASGVVHDFNNTLSVILGYSEMLLRDGEGELDEDRCRSLKAIVTAARDAAYIVKGLRGFYKPRSADDPRTLLSLNEVVEEAIGLTRPRWHDEAQGQGVTITVRRQLGRLPRIMGNEAELREALTNLIFNAVDAMPGGGELTLSTHRDEDMAILEVRDSGVGMAEEVARNALEPFFTTKGEGGTGLGLAMVFGIVARHNGTMAIDSQPGRGTTIRARLPLEASSAPSVEATRATEVPVAPMRILVVDDHPAVRKGFASQLEGDGHSVAVAGDGLAGLDLFQEGDFDVVLTDRAMPALDGVRLAAVIKATSPSTPVIMVSGGDEDEKKPANVDVLLHKPVPLSDLRRALASVSAR